MKRKRESSVTAGIGITNRTHGSYAKVASDSSSRVFGAAPSIPNGKEMLKVYSCIVLASLKSRDDHSSFNGTLNQLFSINDLPKLNTGSLIPPELVSAQCTSSDATVNDFVVDSAEARDSTKYAATQCVSGVANSTLSTIDSTISVESTPVAKTADKKTNGYSVYINQSKCQINNNNQLFSEHVKGNILFMGENGTTMCDSDINNLRSSSFLKLKKSFVPLDKSEFVKLARSCSRILRNKTVNN